MKPLRVSLFILSIIATSLFTSCRRGPQKIDIGKDSCAECKMTIMDARFGGEIITKKGKILKFDDAHCVAIFLERRGVELSSIHRTLFMDYDHPNEFLDVREAEFIVSSQLKSPMGGNAAAFKNKQAAEKRSADFPGSKSTNWATLYNILIK